MEALFLNLLNMSITTGWLVLAVILFRVLFRKAPKSLRVILWALVGIRLMFPFSIESVVSLIPSAETVPVEVLETGMPAVHTGIQAVNTVINTQLNELAEALEDGTISFIGGSEVGAEISTETDIEINPAQELTRWAAVGWIVGMAVMLLYTVISYLRIARKVREAVPGEESGIWLCDHISTPFILGIFRPQIYLPSTMTEQDMEYVIAHERAHLKRKDHWWKPLGFLLLAVYWFNPLIWIAYVLLCRDIELACDERVIREMGAESKKPYSDALINCSVSRKMIAACPLAFGEVGVKGRIKSVLNYKKPGFWVLIVALVGSIIVAVCFLTDPPGNNLDAKLQVFIDCEIANHNQSEKSVDNFCCLDWEVLGRERFGSRTTVYLWALYQEYSYDNGLEVEAGSHMPVVITVDYDGYNYELVEYWTPRDGSYWVEDIRGKFPAYLWGKATDSQRYIKEQLADCDRMAEEHFAEVVIGDEEYDLRYEFKYSEDAIKPTILLNSVDRTFRLVFSGYSSYLPEGNYIIAEGGILVLLDGENRYRFNRENGVYMFDAAKSSPAPIPDRAGFQQVKEGLSEEEWNAPPDDKQVAFPAEAIVDGRIIYRYPYSVESLDPCIVFYPDEQKFSFFHSAFSAFLFFGRYEKVGDILTLKMYDLDAELKFREVDGNYVFLAEESMKIPTYRYAASESKKMSSVPDGAVFELVLPDKILNLTEPPRMVVYQAHEMVEATIGNTVWDYELDDGTRCQLVGCGSAMYENRDRLNVINLEEDDPLLMWLQFGVDPDKITVTCWNLDEENPEPEILETDDVVWHLYPKDGNYVYEIKAEWTEFPRFSGTVEYGFCARKSVIETEAGTGNN
ncbi:MAG: hypothetical protein IJZ85_05985 [Lachnospiraceae bacterium]|nr:hypothetical protein [Lachnospiraceae bacterium]